MDDVQADEGGESEGDEDGGCVGVEGQLAGGGFHGELLCLVVKGETSGSRYTKPTLLGSCAWVFELAAKFVRFA